LVSPVLQRAFVDARIKDNLALFVQRAFEIVAPGEQLHLNWHIYAISRTTNTVGRQGAIAWLTFERTFHRDGQNAQGERPGRCKTTSNW
jgi:hypothetical protein